MWCIAFVASILVAILILMILWLIVWNFTDKVEARISDIITNSTELGQAFIVYLETLFNFVVSPVEKNLLELREVTSDVSEVLSKVLDVHHTKISALLLEKSQLYASEVQGGVERLKVINLEIAELFRKASSKTKSRVTLSLDKLDTFLLSGSQSRIKRQSLISRCVRSMLDASGSRIRNVLV